MSLSYLESLPNELIVENVLKVKSLKDIKSLCLSSKRLNDVVCKSEYFWKKRIAQDLGYSEAVFLEIYNNTDIPPGQIYNIIKNRPLYHLLFKTLNDDNRTFIDNSLITYIFEVLNSSEGSLDSKNASSLYDMFDDSIRFNLNGSFDILWSIIRTLISKDNIERKVLNAVNSNNVHAFNTLIKDIIINGGIVQESYQVAQSSEIIQTLLNNKNFIKEWTPNTIIDMLYSNKKSDKALFVLLKNDNIKNTLTTDILTRLLSYTKDINNIDYILDLLESYSSLNYNQVVKTLSENGFYEQVEKVIKEQDVNLTYATISEVNDDIFKLIINNPKFDFNSDIEPIISINNISKLEYISDNEALLSKVNFMNDDYWGFKLFEELYYSDIDVNVLDNILQKILLFYFKYNEEFDPFYEYYTNYYNTKYYNNNLFINLALKHNLTDIIDIYVNDYNIDLEDILNYFPRNPNDSEKVQIQNIKKYIDGDVDEVELRKFKIIIDSGNLIELQGYIDNPIIKLNVDENYALNKMIANNNIEGVKMLLEDDSVNPNSRHYDGLFEAFRNNSYSIIRLLINDPRFTVNKVLDVLEKYHKIRDIFNTNDMYNFLKIEEFINDNNLDLYQAIVTHNSTDMEKILKINIPTQDLKTIITKYSNGGKIPLFELIINNPNYDQQELLRILRQLYISNNTNLIKFLLFNDGYNKDIYSKILIEAIKNQMNELTFMLLSYPNIDVNYNKEIALWYAVKNKDKDIVVKLLELGANPDNMNSLEKNYTNRRVIDALLNDEGLETKNINKTQEKFSEVKNMEDSLEDVIEKFFFNKALKKYPVGQQRTSNGKQFVFLLDNYAIKGPYNGKGLDKYNNVRARSKQFKKWNTPLILHPLKFFSDEDGSWIVYENIDRGELEVHKHTESFGDKLTYNIAERKKYQKMNEALSEKMFWPYKVSEQLIKALVHMYILNTGDTGLANILVSRRVPKKSIDYKLVKELGLIYFIDYEENRSSDRDDAEFYFSKPSAAKYEWYENTKDAYNKVADSLDNLEVPKEYKDRVKRAQKLLRKYGVESKKTKNLEPEPERDSDSDSESESESVKEPEPVKGSEKGKRLHIQRAVSRNGIQTSVLVSALQKYIRRDIDFDACKAAFELYAFRTNPQAKGIITMLYNRLAIIAAEDIGPANFSLVYNVLLSSKDRNMSPYDLCNMVIEMCQSKKTRIMSWYKYAYGTKDGREKARKAGYEFPENYTDEQVNQIKKEAKRYNLDKYIGVKEKAPKAERNLEHAIEWAIMYKIMLEKRDTLAFFYLGLFNELAYPNKVPDKHSIKVSQISLGDKSTTDVKVVLWYLIKELFPKKIFDIFLHWNYQTDKNKSNMVFLYVLTTAYIYNEDLSKVKQEDYSKNFFPYNVSNMFIPLVNGNYTMKIPDYVLDKHTGAKGKGIKEFVTEGALVTNQDPKYYDKKLEALYMGKE